MGGGGASGLFVVVVVVVVFFGGGGKLPLRFQPWINPCMLYNCHTSTKKRQTSGHKNLFQTKGGHRNGGCKVMSYEQRENIGGRM